MDDQHSGFIARQSKGTRAARWLDLDSRFDPFASTEAQRIAILEARLDQQDAAMRRVMALLAERVDVDRRVSDRGSTITRAV